MAGTALRAGDPAQIGPYRLLGRLGRGGQGVVYLGQAEGGDRVAVKVLDRGLAGDRSARERFVREIEVARQVAEFCTARVLDAGESDAGLYVVSEFIDGPSLQQAITEGGPRDGAALQRIAVGTVTALAAIHQAGIVHRDFKPANVLLAPDGPRVIDFGISRALDASASLTSGVVGTPTYMSPEQIAGERAGPASDVFSWAVTTVFAATGRPAFGADTIPAVLHRILNAEPDLSGVPESLRQVVADCLAKDPAARPAAADLLLRLIRQERPGTPPVLPSGAAPGLSSGRAPGAPAGSAGPAPRTGPGTGPASWAGQAAGPAADPASWAGQAWPTGPSAGSAEPAVPSAQGAPPTVPRCLAPGGSGAAGSGTRRRGVLAGAAGMAVAVVAAGAAVLLAQGPAGRSGPSTGPVAVTAGGASPGPVGSSGGGGTPETGSSPTPSAAATGTAQTAATPLPSPGTPVGKWTSKQVGGALRGHGGGAEDVAVAEAGGGPVIASGDQGGTVRLWDPATGRQTTKMTEHSAWVGEIETVRLGGRTVVVSGSFDRTVRLWDPATGKRIGKPIATGSEVYALATAVVDGEPIAVVGGGDGRLRVWNLATGERVGRTRDTRGGTVFAVAVAEVDGEPVVFTGAKDGRVLRWGLRGGEPLEVGRQNGYVSALATAEPDGRLAVLSAGGDQVIHVDDASGSGPVRSPITGHTGWIFTLAVARVGETTVVVSGSNDSTARVTDLATGKAAGKPFRDHDHNVFGSAVTELDGRPVVVTAGGDGTVRIWRLG
ncbi:hypothetical protein GCM10010466_54940 [Planomonospora alba]|uniref:Protein kinase domain-containing protein n=1 Tax=Planomonospora alba TaxID=161354 RepID=A0ABP6NSA5_9ACTN